MSVDYSTDLLKHYIRQRAWLPACLRQAEAIRGRLRRIPLRYFTFCAVEAMDVFMLERAGVVSRSDYTGRLHGVYFCERELESFGKISDIVGSPDQGFQGDFTEIVTFVDDDDTRNRTLESSAEEVLSEHVRGRLKLKDAHQRLKDSFPFDVINLDVYGQMFKINKPPLSPLLKSILEILKWQTTGEFENGQRSEQFTLFLTAHIERGGTNPEAVQQLANRLAANIDAHNSFAEVFENRFHHRNVAKLEDDDFPQFFCLALPKFLIHTALMTLGWAVSPGPIYLYPRVDEAQGREYQMMHSVSVYNRIPGFGNRLDDATPKTYIDAVIQIVENEVQLVHNIIQDTQVRDDLEADIQAVIDYREQIRVMLKEMNR